MTPVPFPQSFWAIEGLLCAGQYPGAVAEAERDDKLRGLLDAGIRRVVSLMEPDETGRGGRPFEPYEPRMRELATERGIEVVFVRMPIQDASVPTPAGMQRILETLAEGIRAGVPTYLHCWGGHGRTSTVLACHLIRTGCSPQEAIDAIRLWRRPLPKSHFPFETEQAEFVRNWKPNPEE